jgi:hypothetical protein
LSYYRITVGVHGSSGYGVYLRQGEFYALWTDNNVGFTGHAIWGNSLAPGKGLDGFVVPGDLSAAGFGQGDMVFWHWLAMPCWALLLVGIGLLWWAWASTAEKAIQPREAEIAPVLTAWELGHRMA